MHRVPNKLKDAVLRHVLKDLEPSWYTVQFKVASAAILGGTLSLLICGQFGVGFTDLAIEINDKMHQHSNEYFGSIICGFLYAVFPVLILRFVLCSSLQFKVIIKHRKIAFLFWVALFGILIATKGHHGFDQVSVGIWIFSAICATQLYGEVIGKLVPNWDLYENT